MPDQVGYDYSVYPGWYDSYVCHCRLIMIVIAGLTGNLFNHFVYINFKVATLDEIV